MDSSPSSSSSSLSLSSLSLSSSPAGDIWDHDVFLSFRGIDTRKTFTSHLHHALARSGIRIFIDDEELPSGEDINPKLRQAIQRSRASVIVFSQNYASSSWCLEELVEILECKRNKGQMVFPIYYDVEPSVLRFLTGKYAEAFEKHTSRLVDIHKVQKWGDALREVADLKGHVLANEENGNEARFIHKIVGKVQVEVIARSNHILVIGWSDKLGSLLKQLAIANRSIGGGVIVILAERDKEDMEMDISKFELDFMGTSVICRSGSPLILADLKKVSVSKARAIIVLASDENADKSDAHALKVVLSLTGVKEGLRGHVVVEMSELDNEPLMKLVGGELIETVVAHVVIGRLMIQCALQPGLTQIWEDILGFGNAEFHIKRWPQLDGKCFKDVLISFPDAIPCGVKVDADGGKIVLNPDDKYVLREGDEVLVIAEGDDTYAPGPIPEVRRGICPKITEPPKYPEKILFCGWRRDIDDMIMVLEAILAPFSELWIFNEMPEKERIKKLNDGGLDISGLVNIKLVHREGNTIIRRHLENLPLETFDSILILADDSVENSIVRSDSRSLSTLLIIRDIQSKRLPSQRHSGFSHSSWIREMQKSSNRSIIISEILDSRTRNLVSVSRISDYVLSTELVSMALAMVAEDKQINRVLEELFAEEGHEMCIKRSEFFLYDQEELCFYDIMIRGRQRDEIVIGYRLATAERAIINPVNKYELRKWSSDDVFVVISLGEC